MIRESLQKDAAQFFFFKKLRGVLFKKPQFFHIIRSIRAGAGRGWRGAKTRANTPTPLHYPTSY
jgi:hypothetical protein